MTPLPLIVFLVAIVSANSGRPIIKKHRIMTASTTLDTVYDVGTKHIDVK